MYVTSARVRGGGIDLTEAFLVVFRRGGRPLQLPAQVRANGITTFLKVIDIAPASVTGSQESELPIVFGEEDLLPASVEGEDDASGQA